MSAAEKHIGLHVAIGVSGAGKTHGLREGIYSAARDGMPIVVLDQTHEWNEVPEDLAPFTRGTVNVAEAQRHVQAGARIVIVRQDGDPEELGRYLCAWAARHPGPSGVAFSEAQMIMPANVARLPAEILKVATQWRHPRTCVGMWADTQRFALIHNTIIGNARDLRVYGISGASDFAKAREIGDRALEEALRECAWRLQDYQEGRNPNGVGWHVRMGVSKLPPYTIVKAHPDGTLETGPTFGQR